MCLGQRFIARETIIAAAESYEIVEAYPDDKYFSSYLLLGRLGEEAFKVMAFCSEDKTYHCTILGADLRTGKFASAKLKLRIETKGIIEVVRILDEQGDLVSQSLKVEDLARPIVDTERRLALLADQRDKLLELD